MLLDFMFTISDIIGGVFFLGGVAVLGGILIWQKIDHYRTFGRWK